VHQPRFGKGQGAANKAGEALSQGIVPAFDMRRFTCFLSDGGVLILWDHGLIGCPEIREAVARAIRGWNGLPQPTTGRLASIPDRIPHHLPRPAAQRNPDPTLVGFFQNKGPAFIQFQDRRSWICFIRRQHRLAQGRQVGDFFLIQARIVVRETPNVRSSPRRLLRS
jgi:hypothetical protein